VRPTTPEVPATSLARDADLLLAEATFVSSVPPGFRASLSSVSQAGRAAAQAGAAHLALTHLWPGTSHHAARAATVAGYQGEISVAAPGLSLELG
jgi:ribonuclease BN (tRNA processing enzyme)